METITSQQQRILETPSVAGPSSASSFQSTRLTYQLSASTHNRFGAPRRRDSGVQGKVPKTRHHSKHHLRVIVIGSDPDSNFQGRLAAAVVVGGRQQASQQASRKQADESVTSLSLRHSTRAPSGHEEKTSCGPIQPHQPQPIFLSVLCIMHLCLLSSRLRINRHCALHTAFYFQSLHPVSISKSSPSIRTKIPSFLSARLGSSRKDKVGNCR